VRRFEGGLKPGAGCGPGSVLVQKHLTLFSRGVFRPLEVDFAPNAVVGQSTRSRVAGRNAEPSERALENQSASLDDEYFDSGQLRRLIGGSIGGLQTARSAPGIGESTGSWPGSELPASLR
jgi:hypothetical protein